MDVVVVAAFRFPSCFRQAVRITAVAVGAAALAVVVLVEAVVAALVVSAVAEVSVEEAAGRVGRPTLVGSADIIRQRTTRCRDDGWLTSNGSQQKQADGEDRSSPRSPMRKRTQARREMIESV